MAQEREPSSRQYGAPKTDFNVMDLVPGQRIQLVGDATAEVVANPRDGMWVLVRYVASPEDPSQVGNEELAFAEDILAVF